MTIIFVILTMIMYIKKKHVTMSIRLKALRARKGYNQTQLVKRAGIPRQTVFLIERNEFTPSILTAVKISRVIKERVEDVFIIEEEE